MTPVLLAVGAFLAMEGVSAVTHRRLMHGPGMVWHRSHHRPGTGGFERNDLFPVCFSAVGVALFATAALRWNRSVPASPDRRGLDARDPVQMRRHGLRRHAGRASTVFAWFRSLSDRNASKR